MDDFEPYIDSMRSTKEQYILNQKQEYQNNVINIKTASTSTISRYNWTYRTTGCDVISIITTTVPQKNGEMKDIKIYNKEMKRCDILS